MLDEVELELNLYLHDNLHDEVNNINDQLDMDVQYLGINDIDVMSMYLSYTINKVEYYLK